MHDGHSSTSSDGSITTDDPQPPQIEGHMFVGKGTGGNPFPSCASGICCIDSDSIKDK